jgi:hypothetical protein
LLYDYNLRVFTNNHKVLKKAKKVKKKKSKGSTINLDIKKGYTDKKCLETSV